MKFRGRKARRWPDLLARGPGRCLVDHGARTGRPRCRPRLATEARPVAVIGCRAAAGWSLEMISPTTMAGRVPQTLYPYCGCSTEDILPSRYFGRPNSGLSGWSSVRFLDPSATARLQGQLTLLPFRRLAGPSESRSRFLLDSLGLGWSFSPPLCS